MLEKLILKMNKDLFYFTGVHYSSKGAIKLADLIATEVFELGD